jgi:hypothetical protein
VCYCSRIEVSLPKILQGRSSPLCSQRADEMVKLAGENPKCEKEIYEVLAAWLVVLHGVVHFVLVP